MSLPLALSDLFATPAAEREAWLADVFVRPPASETCLDNKSVIVYGLPGSGKTALRLSIQRLAPTDTLVIPWSPEPLNQTETGSVMAFQALRQAIQRLVEHIPQNADLSQKLQQAPAWTHTALAWFLREYLPLDPVFFIQTQAGRLDSAAIDWYTEILQKPAVTIFTANSSHNDQLRMLVNLLTHADIQQVWWMLDGLEKWGKDANQDVHVLVEAILSTLAIFDVPRLVFKIFAPERLRETFAQTSGIARDRLKQVSLRWSEETLKRLLEKRLQAGLKNSEAGLRNLCSDPDFFTWLSCYGGQNPRAWLGLARPFVEAMQVIGSPLSKNVWTELAHKFPPKLKLLSERQEVKIGEAIYSVDSADGFKILKYLSARSGQICSLEEVHYLGIQGLPKIPAINEPEWAHKSFWRPALDTTLYRLRQKIELDSGNPVYIVTHPRRGLELVHAES